MVSFRIDMPYTDACQMLVAWTKYISVGLAIILGNGKKQMLPVVYNEK